MIHPVYAAKALASVDHMSGGRAGLNIVAGWNPDEFAMFGIERDPEGYAQAMEWYEIIVRIFTEPKPFDYDGRFYKLKNVAGKPQPLQLPRPVVLNAAFGGPAATLPRARPTSCSPPSPTSTRARGTSTTSFPAAARSGATSACSPPATWCAGRRKAKPRNTTNATP